MKLFLSERNAALFGNKISPVATKVKRFLDKAPDGELFTTLQLSLLVRHNPNVIRQNAYLLPGYCHKVRVSLRYWGKPKTIKQLRQKVKR